MLIQTHKLILTAGQIVTAKISAESPLGQYPVEWSGPVELLPKVGMMKLDNPARVSSLNVAFKNWALMTGGKHETESSGTYDREER